MVDYNKKFDIDRVCFSYNKHGFFWLPKYEKQWCGKLTVVIWLKWYITINHQRYPHDFGQDDPTATLNVTSGDVDTIRKVRIF